MTTTPLKQQDWAHQSRNALSPTQLVAQLAQIQGWQLSGDGPSVTIEKIYAFQNYYETMAFVNAVALIAHQQDHHPELLVQYSSCRVRLNTHDVGGVSATDFDCARRIDALLA